MIIREITIQEYLPGAYDVSVDGRKMTCPSREELRRCLCDWLGDLPDPRVTELEREVDMLREDVKDLERHGD